MNSSTNLCLKKDFPFVLGLSMTFTHIWQKSAGLNNKRKDKQKHSMYDCSIKGQNLNNTVKCYVMISLT